MNDDLLSAEIDNGEVIEKNYDAEDDKEAPKERLINLGYGKAEVSSNKLLITSKNVFVPNAFDYLDETGKKVSAGYFSYSALTTYRRCQRLFKFRYVDKISLRQPAPKMWGGSAIHDAIELMLQAKIDNPQFSAAIRNTMVHNVAKTAGASSGIFSLDSIRGTFGGDLPFTNESIKKVFKETYQKFSSEYAQAKARALQNGEPPLPDATWGARVETEQEFHVKYLNAIDGYIQKEYARVNPQSIEDLVVYHFPLHTGGTVPIVGFIDLIEKTDFMADYYNEVYATKEDMDADAKDYAKKTIKSIDTGEAMITDHKCGMAKSYEDARTDQQLTLYSLAKKIPVVGFNSITLGTTGGKRPDRAKPAVINKIFARRKQKDYEDLTDDFNAIIKGISSGIYDKSGASNSMVCSPTLCPYYSRCFGQCK